MPTPVTWPVGIAGDFRGVIDRRSGEFIRFTRTARGATEAPEELVDPERAAAEEGEAWTAARRRARPARRQSGSTRSELFDGGEQPRRCSSARRSPTSAFGCCSTRSSTSRPAPSPREDADGKPRDLDAPFSGFVFKVQANMDPAHRDRIAFLRICSGRFERGMVVTHGPTGKPFATKYAHPVFGQERETVEEAYPGDVVGLVNATDVRVGDTLWVDEPVDVPDASRASPPSTSRSPGRATPAGSSSSARASPSSTRRASSRSCATPSSVTRRRCSPPSGRCSSRWRSTGSRTSSARRSSSAPPATRWPAAPTRPARRRCGPCAASTCSAEPTARCSPCSRARYWLDRLLAEHPELTLERLVAGELA